MKEKKEEVNILIIHAHWNNRGDEAAIRAMIDALRPSLPIGRISIMIFSRGVPWFPYDDIEILSPFPSKMREIFDGMITMLSLGRISFTKSGKRFIEAINESDAVIHAPGGPSIGDIYRGGLSSYLYLYRLFFARIIKNKPIFFYAPSMGPFTNRFDNLARRFLLKRASAIILREGISARYLEEQLDLKSIVTCDSALQNVIPDGYLDRYDNIASILKTIEEKRVIGMTVTDLRWHPVLGKDIALSIRIKEAISGAIGQLLEKGYDILLIPQLFGDDTDIPLLEQFKELNQERIAILPDNVDSYGQQILMSKLHSIISLRHHPNILAAKGRIPFLSISYEYKMKGFVDQLGLPELSMNVEEITAQKIIDKFQYLEDNYLSISRALEDRMPDLERLSKKTTEIIAEMIRNGILR